MKQVVVFDSENVQAIKRIARENNVIHDGDDIRHIPKQDRSNNAAGLTFQLICSHIKPDIVIVNGADPITLSMFMLALPALSKKYQVVYVEPDGFSEIGKNLK